MDVFVYGTLRAGEPNHSYLAACTRLLSCARVPGFVLYDLGPFPAACPAPEGRDGVLGELYRVTQDATLAMLDQLEGYPELYDRGEVRVLDPQEGVWPARMYFMHRPPQSGRPIPGGDWLRE